MRSAAEGAEHKHAERDPRRHEHEQDCASAPTRALLLARMAPCA
jgi:hypothetical protein